MKKIYLSLQTGLLLAGTLFSGYAVTNNFIRFYHSEGTLFKIYDCAIPNPVTEACFYGSLGFLAAFIWSLFIYRKSVLKSQTYLWWFLSAGTIFAWYNVTKEFLAYYSSKTGTLIACGGQTLTSPYLTPCFTGASIFLLSAIIGGIIVYKLKLKK